MKRITTIIVLLFSLASGSAFAATAYFTGRMEQAQSVTYQIVWNCEYNYLGQTFWRAFRSSCPSSVEVY
jgi:ribosome biogenesis protein Tsr3